MKTTFFLLLILLSGFYTRAQEDLRVKYPKTYKAVLRTINNLPETREFFITARGSKPIVYVDGPGTTGNSYWWVKVGSGNLEQLRTNFDFLVNPKTLKVYYLDNYMEGDEGPDAKLITLQQWRKWRTMPGWKKIHHYKSGKFVALAK